MFPETDLSNGFWRMLVAEDCKWNFAYTLQGTNTEPVCIVIPHALQMGFNRGTSVRPQRLGRTFSKR